MSDKQLRLLLFFIRELAYVVYYSLGSPADLSREKALNHIRLMNESLEG